jgi:alpha-1,3-mannosyltransferase
MSQVTGFVQGERDYKELKGGTGPIVYPAGHLYIFTALQQFTNGNVPSAQVSFGDKHLCPLLSPAVLLS